jgi:hypothetical protein
MGGRGRTLAEPPYLHPSVTARVRCEADAVAVVLVRACLRLLPSLIAAGFCERAGGSGGAQRPHGGAAGALDAIVRERIMPGGGTGKRSWWQIGFSGSGRVAFLCG